MSPLFEYIVGQQDPCYPQFTGQSWSWKDNTKRGPYKAHDHDKISIHILQIRGKGLYVYDVHNKWPVLWLATPPPLSAKMNKKSIV